MKNIIKVDEVTHRYYINLPSVSKLIKLIPKFKNDYLDLDPKFLKPYQVRGICFHKRIEEFINNEFDFGCICEVKVQEHELFFENWIIWWNGIKHEIIDYKTEQSLFNNYFCGTFDFLYQTKDGNWHLLDWKTNKSVDNKFREKTLTQLMLYEVLIKDNLKVLRDTKMIYECFNPNANIFIQFEAKEILLSNRNVNYILGKIGYIYEKN